MAESDRSVVVREFDACVWGTDAQEVWKALRAAGPIVHPRDDLVVATSTEAVREVLASPNLFSSNPEAGYFGSETGAIPLQIDPPDHVTYRKILDPLFTPRKMAQRKAEVEALANDLIDGFIERGSCDFIAEFAVPFPSAMFLRLMGLPYDDLDAFLLAKEGMIRPEGDDEETRRAAMEKTSAWIFSYFNAALDRKAAEPAEDVSSYLVALEAEGRLTRAETLNILVLLIPAGLDTVTDTLGCSFAFLAQHPEHRRQLSEDPSLVPAAVEELMRYETPVPVVNRIATADATVDGCPVSVKQKVRVLLASPNHDPEIYDDPDTVDFTRSSNRHNAFGGGVHRCLGSHLARLELQVAMAEWHRRIPDYRLEDGHQIRFRTSLREIPRLPLEFTPGPRSGSES
ncbi:MAG TPA: cytochrome P450 [Acidimicrobiales bacterium]|nr:cytochrome P450 [Acidimicrobiales bacterium]